MIFVRAEHVEVLDAADAPVESGAPRVEVEDVLRKRVAVERPQRMQVGGVGEVVLERAVSGRR